MAQHISEKMEEKKVAAAAKKVIRLYMSREHCQLLVGEPTDTKTEEEETKAALSTQIQRVGMQQVTIKREREASATATRAKAAATMRAVEGRLAGHANGLKAGRAETSGA